MTTTEGAMRHPPASDVTDCVMTSHRSCRRDPRVSGGRGDGSSSVSLEGEGEGRRPILLGEECWGRSIRGRGVRGRGDGGRGGRKLPMPMSDERRGVGEYARLG